MWDDLVRSIESFRPAVRVKWSGDDMPTEWEPWLIVPVPSYLETGRLGPVPFREVEWVEIDPAYENVRGRLVPAESIERRHLLIAAVNGVGLHYTLADGKLRFDAQSA